MSRNLRAIASYDLARRVRITREKFAAGDFLKEGILNLDLVIVPVDHKNPTDPSNLIPLTHKVLPGEALFHMNGLTVQKVYQYHYLNRQLLRIYDAKIGTFPDPTQTFYAKLLKLITHVIVPATAVETFLYGAGFINYLRRKGFLETKKKLVEKLIMNEQIKSKELDKNLKQRIVMVKELVENINSMTSKATSVKGVKEVDKGLKQTIGMVKELVDNINSKATSVKGSKV